MDIRFAKIHKIHKYSFLSALTKNLWRPHNCPPPISSQLWVILTQNVKHPTKKLQSNVRRNNAVSKAYQLSFYPPPTPPHPPTHKEKGDNKLKLPSSNNEFEPKFNYATESNRSNKLRKHSSVKDCAEYIQYSA